MLVLYDNEVNQNLEGYLKSVLSVLLSLTSCYVKVDFVNDLI